MSERVDEVKSALIEALVRLLKERSIARISVRDIAAEAGVNHGLVHRHFGSKEGLVKAAARRLSEELHAGDPVQRGMSAASFAQLRARPELAEVVARACLDGPVAVVKQAAPSPERLEELVAPTRRTLERLGLSDVVDPHVVNALASGALLGWFVFRPLFDSGFGLPSDADDQLAALLERVDALLAPFRK